MRPLKMPREELLHRCAITFKRYGYHGTTMDLLSGACGLTKASFYHHYSNKDALLIDILSWTHEQLRTHLLSIAHDATLSPRARLQAMGRCASKLFQDDVIGCLMAVVAVDVSYTNEPLMQPIRAFLDDWAAAFAQLFKPVHDEASATHLGRQLVADFEGAILLARIYDDARYIHNVIERTATQLPD